MTIKLFNTLAYAINAPGNAGVLCSPAGTSTPPDFIYYDYTKAVPKCWSFDASDFQNRRARRDYWDYKIQRRLER